MVDPFDDDYVEPAGQAAPDGCSYCTNCGTVIVTEERNFDCPTCAIAERVEALDDELDEIAEHQADVLEEGVGSLFGEDAGGVFGGLLGGGSDDAGDIGLGGGEVREKDPDDRDDDEAGFWGSGP